MRNFFLLTKVHFLSFYGINKVLHSKKKKLLSGALGLILLALFVGGAIAFMGYTYAETFAMMLSAERLTEVFALMIAIASLLGFFLSFYTTGTVLYSFKDYEMTAALPVKTRVFVLSKLFFMYVTDLLFTLLLVVPTIIVFVNLTGAIVLDLIVRLVILIFVVPLFPLALSVAVGAVFQLVSSRFNKRNLVQTIMYVAVFALCFGVGFMSGSGELIDMTGSLSKIYFVMPMAINAVNGYAGLLWFALLSIGSAVIVVFAVCLTYKKMNTLMTARRTKKNFKLKSYKGKSEFSCLLGKEVKRLFSTPIYVMNSLFGSIMGVAFSIIFAVIISSLNLPADVGGVIVLFAPAIYAFAFMLSPTTACSISVEGSSFWIIKTAPVSAKKLINVKLFVNLLFGVLPALISSVALAVGFIGTPFILLALMVLCAILIALLGGSAGLLYNLLFPMMKWDNVQKAVKQGLSLILCIVTAFAFTALFVVGAIYLPISSEIILTIYVVTLLLLNVIVYGVLMTKGEKLIVDKT